MLLKLTLLVSEVLRPDFTLSRWKQAIKTDAFFGRYFGFHYQSDIRHLLRMTLVAKETVHKTYEGCQKEPKLKTISVGSCFCYQDGLISLIMYSCWVGVGFIVIYRCLNTWV